MATRTQLAEAGLTDADDKAGRALAPDPGAERRLDHVVRGAAKPVRGVFIGTLCIRHTGRQTLLEEQGWEEVPVRDA